jgi:hypothetical protein
LLLSWLFVSSLFSARSFFLCWCRAYWYPIKTYLLEFAGTFVPWWIADMIILHSLVETYIFSFSFPLLSLVCCPVCRLLGCRLMRRKRIYNFCCSMLVLHQLLCVLFTLCGIFMHFPELTY